ncbi:GPI-anchored surface protein, putative, partial [Bodo saltans]
MQTASSIHAFATLWVLVIVPTQIWSLTPFSVTVSDPTHRRGRVLLTPLGTSDTTQGTMCSNAYFDGMVLYNKVDSNVANVTCNAANMATELGGIILCNYGESAGSSATALGPIYMQGVECNEPASSNLSTCMSNVDPYSLNVTGCTHGNDVGVVCSAPVMGGSSAL